MRARHVAPSALALAAILIGVLVVGGGAGAGARTPAAAASATTAPSTTATSTTATSTTAGTTGGAGAGRTVWLCRPGMAHDPCTSSLTATVDPATGKPTVQHASDATDPPIDCFYVYPTVSDQQTPNATLSVDPAETSVAVAQASRFSQVCKVYAPIYPQVTLYGLLHPATVTEQDRAEAFAGALSGWKDYLAHYNHGRGFVLIGHSQGAAILIDLIRSQIDDDPALRKHLVSAIILGGNVTVPVGKTVGGSFEHVPACRAVSQTGCVVAYSSFDTTPPTSTLFGKAGQGVSALSGTSSSTPLEVLCTNPASLRGGPGLLEPYFPSSSVIASLGATSPTAKALTAKYKTAWVTTPDLYSGTCEYEHGISWLQVDDVAKPGDTRPVVHETLGPTWGLHLVDVNIALGNLVSLVRSQAKAYAHRHR